MNSHKNDKGKNAPVTKKENGLKNSELALLYYGHADKTFPSTKFTNESKSHLANDWEQGGSTVDVVYWIKR